PKPENYRWYADHQKQGDFTLFDLGPRLSTNMFWFNLNKVRKQVKGKKLGQIYVDPVKYAWFNNRDFRRAVSMAIDRDAMITSIFFGSGVKNWSTMTPGNKLWYSSNVVHFDYEGILVGLESATPPDPGMGNNVWRSSGRTHYWNMTQPKPETPAEARIDQLMDVIVGTTDLNVRKPAWQEIENTVNDQCW